jgi:DNA-binding NtrC family response regulator
LKREILLVEDDDDLREIITDYFVSDGFSVVAACDGQQALLRPPFTARRATNIFLNPRSRSF